MSNIQVDSQKISGSSIGSETENSESEIEWAAITHCPCNADNTVNSMCVTVCKHAVGCDCGADSDICDGKWMKECEEGPLAMFHLLDCYNSKKNLAYCLSCNHYCEPPNQVSQ